ncbi:hypothetical protein HDU97_007880, partial [Phlyctochytrium planicorne]
MSEDLAMDAAAAGNDRDAKANASISEKIVGLSSNMTGYQVRHHRLFIEAPTKFQGITEARPSRPASITSPTLPFSNSKYFPTPSLGDHNPPRGWFFPSKLLEAVACMVAPVAKSCPTYILRFNRPLTESWVSVGAEGLVILRLSLTAVLMAVLGDGPDNPVTNGSMHQDALHPGQQDNFTSVKHESAAEDGDPLLPLPLTLSFSIVDIVEHMHASGSASSEWNRLRLFVPDECSENPNWQGRILVSEKDGTNSVNRVEVGDQSRFLDISVTFGLRPSTLNVSKAAEVPLMRNNGTDGSADIPLMVSATKMKIFDRLSWHKTRIEDLGGMVRVDACSVESNVAGNEQEGNGLRVWFRFPVIL